MRTVATQYAIGPNLHHSLPFPWNRSLGLSSHSFQRIPEARIDGAVIAWSLPERKPGLIFDGQRLNYLGK